MMLVNLFLRLIFNEIGFIIGVVDFVVFYLFLVSFGIIEF